jgi:hypothetical protein
MNVMVMDIWKWSLAQDPLVFVPAFLVTFPVVCYLVYNNFVKCELDLVCIEYITSASVRGLCRAAGEPKELITSLYGLLSAALSLSCSTVLQIANSCHKRHLIDVSECKMLSYAAAPVQRR